MYLRKKFKCNTGPNNNTVCSRLLNRLLKCFLFVGGKEEATKPTIPELPCLSEQLALEELWDILGECLIELGKSSDSHAVLVLQPAVEAFFLVHGTEKQDTGTSNTTQAQTRDHSQRLNSLSMDHLPPVSPGPISPGPFSPNRQMSVTSISSDLPSDTQKFLKFAGELPVNYRNTVNCCNLPIACITVCLRHSNSPWIWSLFYFLPGKN